MIDGQLKRVYASTPFLYKIKPRSKGFIFNVFKSRLPIKLSLETLVKIHPQLQILDIKEDIMVPISNKNKTIGVLTFMSIKKDFFTKQDIEALKLFGQISTLAIQNVRLYDQTRKALESRDLFISMASHEIRTPLTSINGYAQLISGKLKNHNNDETRWAKELEAEVKRLNFMFNELSEASRSKTEIFNYYYSTNSLKEIINKVINNTKFLYPKHKIVFLDNLTLNDTIVSDLNKLIQAIGNIAGNAAKFSSSNKKITIRLSSHNKNFILEIKDKGIGINKKDLKFIFEKFQKGSNHSKEGMGLGLFLANEIIKQHHGAIQFESELGQGTTVTIKLPKVKHG